MTHIEIQKYNQNEPRFNGVYCKNNLHNKKKDVAYVINLDEYAIIGTHWIALYVSNNCATYFDKFGVEHVPKEIKKFIGSKNRQTNIYRIQANSSIMCGHFALDLLILCLQARLWLIIIACFRLMI